MSRVVHAFSTWNQVLRWGAALQTRSDCVITRSDRNALSLPSNRWSGKTLDFAGQNSTVMQHHLYLLSHWPNFWRLLSYREGMERVKLGVSAGRFSQRVPNILAAVLCARLPCTVTVMCLWATPAGLRAEHVYLPAWLGRAAVISNPPVLKVKDAQIQAM